jgi:hypothetical protein
MASQATLEQVEQLVGQLPAGVPGAYRLFANLISLPKTR